MADPLRDTLGELAKNLGQLVSKLDNDVDKEVKVEGRLSKLESNVNLLMWLCGGTALAVIGAIVAAIATLLKGH